MARTSEKEIRALVREVYRYGCYDHRGQKAITSIAEIGESAIPVVLSVMNDPPKSDLHGRDLAESIQAIFTRLAGTAPDALIDLMERDPDSQSLVVWALGNAKGRRSIDVLVAALKDKNMWVRWAAVESLIRRRSKRAVDPLIGALRDRSPMVKFSVVHVMVKQSMYRRRRAMDALHRIVASKSIKKNSPGLWKEAAGDRYD